jgi:hypothetical protein
MSKSLMTMIWDHQEKRSAPIPPSFASGAKVVQPGMSAAPTVAPVVEAAPGAWRNFGNGAKNLAWNAGAKPGVGGLAGWSIGEAATNDWTAQQLKANNMGGVADFLQKNVNPNVTGAFGAAVGGRNMLREVPWSSTAGGKAPAVWTTPTRADRIAETAMKPFLRTGDGIAKVTGSPAGVAGTILGSGVPIINDNAYKSISKAIQDPETLKNPNAAYHKVTKDQWHTGAVMHQMNIAAKEQEANQHSGGGWWDSWKKPTGPTPPVTPTTPIPPVPPPKDKSFLSNLPNWTKGLGLGVGALGAGMLADSFGGEEEDEDGNKKKKMPWLGPLVGAGGLAAGLGYLTDWDYGKLGQKDWWMGGGTPKTAAANLPMVMVPYLVKLSFDPPAPIPGLPKPPTAPDSDPFALEQPLQSPVPGASPAPQLKMPQPPTPPGYKPPASPELQPSQPSPTTSQVPGAAPAQMPKPQNPPGYAPEAPAPQSKMPQPAQPPGYTPPVASELQPDQPSPTTSQVPGTTPSQMSQPTQPPGYTPPAQQGSGRAITDSIVAKLQARGVDPTDPAQIEKGKQHAAAEIAKVNPEAAKKPGFMDMIGVWWDSLGSMKQIMLIAGLGIGAVSLLGGIGGGGGGKGGDGGGGMMGPLLGIAGLGTAAWAAGAFDSDSLLRKYIGGTWGVDKPQTGDPAAAGQEGQVPPLPAPGGVSSRLGQLANPPTFFDANGQPNKIALLTAINDPMREQQAAYQFKQLPPPTQQAFWQQIEEAANTPGPMQGMAQKAMQMLGGPPGGAAPNFNEPGGNPAANGRMDYTVDTLLKGPNAEWNSIGSEFPNAPPRMQAELIDAAYKRLDETAQPTGNPVADQAAEKARRTAYDRLLSPIDSVHNDVAVTQLRTLLAKGSLPDWDIEQTDPVSKGMMVQKLQQALNPEDIEASRSLGVQLTPENITKMQSMITTLQESQLKDIATKPLTGANLMALKQVIGNRSIPGETWQGLLKQMPPENQAVVKKLLSETETQMTADSDMFKNPMFLNNLNAKDPKAMTALTRQLTHRNSDWIGPGGQMPKEMAEFGLAVDQATKFTEPMGEPNSPEYQQAYAKLQAPAQVIRRTFDSMGIDTTRMDDLELMRAAAKFDVPVRAAMHYMGQQQDGMASVHDDRNYLFGSQGRYAGLKQHIPVDQAPSTDPIAALKANMQQATDTASKVMPASPVVPPKVPTYDAYDPMLRQNLVANKLLGPQERVKAPAPNFSLAPVDPQNLPTPLPPPLKFDPYKPYDFNSGTQPSADKAPGQLPLSTFSGFGKMSPEEAARQKWMDDLKRQQEMQRMLLPSND